MILLINFNKSQQNFNFKNEIKFRQNKYISIFISLIIPFFVGFSPITFFTGDWIDARWDFSFFLASTPWPSSSGNFNVVEGETGVLRHYMGFYLPPALISKILYFFIGPSKLVLFIVLYFWIALGIFLILQNFQMYFKKKYDIVYYSVGFIFFSGLDIIGAILVKSSNLWSLGWYAGISNYLSNFESLIYPTNAFIASLLVLSICMGTRVKNWYIESFLIFLIIFWSPFLAIPFVYLILIQLFNNIINKEFNELKSKVKSYSISILILLIPMAILYIYYSLPPSPLKINLIELNFENIKVLIIFYILEFLIYIYILYKLNFNKYYLFTLTLFLTILPLLYIGNASELSTKGSMPIIMLLSIFVLYTLKNTFQINLRHDKFLILLFATYIIGSIAPMVDLSSHLKYVPIKLSNSWNWFGKELSSNGFSQLSDKPCLNITQDRCRLSGRIFSNFNGTESQYWAFKSEYEDLSFFRNTEKSISTSGQNFAFLSINMPNEIEYLGQDSWVWVRKGNANFSILLDNSKINQYSNLIVNISRPKNCSPLKIDSITTKLNSEIANYDFILIDSSNGEIVVKNLDKGFSKIDFYNKLNEKCILSSNDPRNVVYRINNIYILYENGIKDYIVN